MLRIRFFKGIVLLMIFSILITINAFATDKVSTKAQINKAVIAVTKVEKTASADYYSIITAQKELDIATKEVSKVKSFGKMYIKNYNSLFQRIALVKKKVNDRIVFSKNNYLPLKVLPTIYPSNEARANGDIVSVHGEYFNEKKFVEFINKYYKGQESANKMIRIVAYTDEGDPIIYDLMPSAENIKLIVDMTRDKYGSKENRIRKEYLVIGFKKLERENGTLYTAVTDDGQEIPIPMILISNCDNKLE